MTRFRLLAVSMVLAAAAMLSGCGTTPQDRGVSGAGIGAAGGAIVGALTDVAILPAALIGAAVGGVTGAATNPDVFNLGNPPWARRADGAGSRASVASASRTPARTHRARQAAADPPRPASGRTTATADAGSREQVRAIQMKLSALGYSPGRADGLPGARTRQAIRAYQKAHHLPVDGQPTAWLARAIDTEIARLTWLTHAGDQAAQADPAR